MKLEYEDAMNLLLRWFQSPDHGNQSSYGYDFYLPSMVRMYLRKEKGINSQFEVESELKEMMPVLYGAAWDLCRRGILRPGIREYGAQATDDGNAGNGYSITPFGRSWLQEKDKDYFVPTEPERFAKMLSPYKERYGGSFHQRAQEAIRCYGAHAYLACCAMCGAAAESILITTAIAKSDEARVLKEYFSSGGRRRVENILLGKARDQLREEYKGFTALIKYWRDAAAHGAQSNISDNEAYTAMASLLRFAFFVNDNWQELTSG
jgi:hypothetical protein